jgi:hypothetical protein
VSELFDPDAEEDLIACLVSRNAAVRDVGLREVDSADFYDMTNARAFSAIGLLRDRGEEITATTLADAMRGPGMADVDENRLRSWFQTERAITVAVRDYAAIVRRHSDARRVREIGHRMMNGDRLALDPYLLREESIVDLANVGAKGSAESKLLYGSDFENLAENPAPWLIPDMLQRGMRAVIVASEGAGKSTLLRQIALKSSQGKEPFRNKVMDPIRALIVDLENPKAVIAETTTTIIRQLRRDVDDYDDGRCAWLSMPAGIDLRAHRHRAELEAELSRHRPDLVCIGPANKMTFKRGNENDEEATAPVLQVLDDLRDRYDFSVLVEHHAPQGERGQRDMRPIGSYRWMAWPDMGIKFVTPKGTKPGDVIERLTLGRFRGDRLPVAWPTGLERGTIYPWIGTYGTPKSNGDQPPLADEESF